MFYHRSIRFKALVLLILLAIASLIFYLTILPYLDFRSTLNITYIILLLLFVAIYFLPAFIGRRKRNARAIFVLNLLLGWTFLGWVGTLIWALLRESPAPDTTPSHGKV